MSEFFKHYVAGQVCLFGIVPIYLQTKINMESAIVDWMWVNVMCAVDVDIIVGCECDVNVLIIVVLYASNFTNVLPYCEFLQTIGARILGTC
jgi:hypothetical protein